MGEVPAPASGGPLEPLAAARAATARHAWDEAFAAMGEADRAGQLSGDDLEAYAVDAFFAGHPEVRDEATERAFKARLEEGDTVRAAYLAIVIARWAGMLGNTSIAAGWFRRAERLLEPETGGPTGGGDTYAHGYLALARSEAAAGAGDDEAAIELVDRAIAIGTRRSDADLRAWALAHLGELKIAHGETQDGIALLEEASVAAVSGELTPVTSGITACRMIAACRDLSDYGRAGEWIEAADRYCQRQSIAGFPGVCRVHRAEVTAIGGSWEQAEIDLVRATAELEAYRITGPQADGFYALGDIRRLRGDLDGAEAALREAHVRGKSPQPALALIRLAQGKPKAAANAIEAAMEEAGGNRWARARLLPARIEIQIATGDAAAARASLAELDEIVATYQAPALEAGRVVAGGRVLLAEGDAAGAAKALRAGIRGWTEVRAPYEVARARALLAEAMGRQGDVDDALLELIAARDEYLRLGAAGAAADAERALRDLEDRTRAPEQVRRAFMFTDIVGSTTLAEALGDAAWERLLRWHDETLRRHIAAGGGEVVNSTGDGFFAAFATSRRAIDCAIDLQQALRDHQESIGFAPPIRIGVHTADANRRGHDYSGIGVHVAARVGALAGAGEIVVTIDTLEDAGLPGEGAAEEVAIKGVSGTIRVCRVPWT